MIFYTIYTSVPVGTVTKKSVDQITQESIAWNKQHGITGMLMCLDDQYVQLLEGEEEEVNEIFEKIRQDPRHAQVMPRVKGFSKTRIFSEWSMGSWMLSNEEIHSLPAVADIQAYLQDPTNAPLQSKRFIAMMDNILKTWIAHEPERSKKLRE